MNLSSPIYRQYQCKNASKKTTLHKQNMPESSQEQSTDPSNWGASKDHHTNLIPIPSTKHINSFAVNYKNDSNISNRQQYQKKKTKSYNLNKSKKYYTGKFKRKSITRLNNDKTKEKDDCNRWYHD